MAGTVPPLEEQVKEKPVDQVTTYDLSNLTWGFAGFRYNPDDLASRRGLKIYQQMLNDEQVKAVVEFKLAAILARGWQFVYENSDLPKKKQVERINLFEVCLRKMRGSFLDALEGIASGREYGYSMTEKVYGTVMYEDTPYTGINQLLTRDPSSFIFKTDAYGNTVEVRQQVTGQQEVVIDMSRMIHYVHSPKWDSIFGRSDLRAAHRSWYAKDNLVKLELLYLEKFGGGTAVAKRVTDDAPHTGTTEHVALQNALKNISSLRSIILPKGVELEILYPNVTTQFREAITYHDLAIAKALLVPNLLGLSHTGQTGAFAQSQTQLQAFFWTLNTDASRLEECLNEQLFRDLGEQNWGDGDYPRFKFKKADVEHTKWIVSTWKEMLGVKAVLPTEDDEKFLRELLEMPERDEKSVILENPVELRKEEEAKKAQADALAQQQADQKAQQEGMQKEIDEQKTATDEAKKDVEKLSAQLEALRFGYNPDQPRDERGRFGEGAWTQLDKSSLKDIVDKARAEITKANAAKAAQFDKFKARYDSAKNAKTKRLIEEEVRWKLGFGAVAGLSRGERPEEFTSLSKSQLEAKAIIEHDDDRLESYDRAQIKTYVRHWYRRLEASSRKFTAEEKRAISEYTGDGFEGVRTSLHKGKIKDHDTIAALDRVATSHVLKEDIYVYRGIRGVGAKISRGKTYVDKSFQSTSMSARMAVDFGSDGGKVLQIRIPKGTRVGFLNRVSDNSGEWEVLLPRNSTIKVGPRLRVNAQTDEDYRVLAAEYVRSKK